MPINDHSSVTDFPETSIGWKAGYMGRPIGSVNREAKGCA